MAELATSPTTSSTLALSLGDILYLIHDMRGELGWGVGRFHVVRVGRLEGKPVGFKVR